MSNHADDRDDAVGDGDLERDSFLALKRAELSGKTSDLPAPWSIPARLRQDGYFYLRYGSTERPLHRLVFMLRVGIDPTFKRGDEPIAMTCAYCGKVVWFGKNVNIDHVDGDKANNAPTNLVCSCIGCNRKKGSEDWSGRVKL